METKNIFDDVPGKIPEEIIQQIISAGNVRIEKIISKGHCSPEDFWYDQDENEWVIVLRGNAKLKFAENDLIVELGEGDFTNIPAHKKHRVEWTNPETETIWLAVFY